MQETTDFAIRYKELSNAELLAILQHQEDYLPEAVVAATHEWNSRELSPEQQAAATAALQEVKDKTAAQQAKIHSIETNLRSGLYQLWGKLNPVKANLAPTDKIIRALFLFFTLLFLAQLITNFRQLRYTLNDFREFPLEFSIYLLPLLLSGLTIVFFYLRKTAGWHFMNMVFIFKMMELLFALFFAITWDPHPVNGNGLIFTYTTDLFAPPPISELVIQLLICCAFLGTLWKKAIRDHFSVSDEKALYTVAITAVITFFLLYGPL